LSYIRRAGSKVERDPLRRHGATLVIELVPGKVEHIECERAFEAVDVARDRDLFPDDYSADQFDGGVEAPRRMLSCRPNSASNSKSAKNGRIKRIVSTIPILRGTHPYKWMAQIGTDLGLLQLQSRLQESDPKIQFQDLRSPQSLDTIEKSLAVGLAQLVERQIVVLEVVGSIPTSHPT